MFLTYKILTGGVPRLDPPIGPFTCTRPLVESSRTASCCRPGSIRS
jgi:hypothetical protein